MISMTVERDPSDPRVTIVSGGDVAERDLWLANEAGMLAGMGRTVAFVRGGARTDDPADTRSEAEIRADASFSAIYIEEAP